MLDQKKTAKIIQHTPGLKPTGEVSRQPRDLQILRTRLFLVGFNDLLCCFSAKAILQICHALSYRNTHSLFKAIGFSQIMNVLRTPGNTGLGRYFYISGLTATTLYPASTHTACSRQHASFKWCRELSCQLATCTFFRIRPKAQKIQATG